MKCIIKASIEKVALIPPTNVLQPMFEGYEGDGIWMVQSQQIPMFFTNFNPLSLNMHFTHVNG
jgi:hypothetical protein